MELEVMEEAEAEIELNELSGVNANVTTKD